MFLRPRLSHGGMLITECRYALYSSFSPGFQKYLEGLYAVHSAVAQADGMRAAGLPVRREPIETIHPIVRVHPATGWKSIYVNPGACSNPSSSYQIHLSFICTLTNVIYLAYQASRVASSAFRRPNRMQFCTCSSMRSARTQISRSVSIGSPIPLHCGTTG